MNEQPNPNAGTEQPTADETFTWTDPTATGRRAADAPMAAATADRMLAGSESDRAARPPPAAATAIARVSCATAIDDLAERAAPTVREVSARAAELAAVAADKAAPFAEGPARRPPTPAGKLAEQSRAWAAEIRARGRRDAAATTATAAAGDGDTAPDAADAAAPEPADAGRPTPSGRRRTLAARVAPPLAILAPHERPPHRPARRPAPAAEGPAVDSFGKYLHELLDDLAHTMRDAPGVGLAAPQLGEALQACVIEVEGQLHELVNPRIVRATATTATSRAACRSRATSPT